MTIGAGKICIACGQNASSLDDINNVYCYRHIRSSIR